MQKKLNLKKLNDRNIEIVCDDKTIISFEPLAALEVCYAICEEFNLDNTQFQKLENKLLEEKKIYDFRNGYK